MEWIAVLRERRSRMNRIIADSKKLLQMGTKNIERNTQTEWQSEESHATSIACKHKIHALCPHKRKRTGGSKTQRLHKKITVHARVNFDMLPNKCLQKAILALANERCANVYEVLLRMFRASCANASASGRQLASV